MDTQTLDKKIVEYLPKLGKGEKKTILEVIKSFIDLKQKNQVDIEQYNKDIEIAEQEIAEGKFYTHEEVKKMAQEWKKRAV
ncbi:MAG: hypothetical protein H6553_04030 [Chitinophagales bacterium]|nr:hypothetical protein [Chitinophagales bacterium]